MDIMKELQIILVQIVMHYVKLAKYQQQIVHNATSELIYLDKLVYWIVILAIIKIL